MAQQVESFNMNFSHLDSLKQQRIPFTRLTPGNVSMPGRSVQVRADYLQNCVDAMENVISLL